jgi:hypothetical protein
MVQIFAYRLLYRDAKDVLSALVPSADSAVEVAGDDGVRGGGEERVDPRVEGGGVVRVSELTGRNHGGGVDDLDRIVRGGWC